jgi:hypothetical protein
MELIYPPITDPTRTLNKVFSIQAGELYDTIFLGKIRLGWVAVTEDSNQKHWIFTPEASQENPFPNRDSYAEVWQDILTLISNDIDLAIELTIKVQNKAVDDELF